MTFVHHYYLCYLTTLLLITILKIGDLLLYSNVPLSWCWSNEAFLATKSPDKMCFICCRVPFLERFLKMLLYLSHVNCLSSFRLCWAIERVDLLDIEENTKLRYRVCDSYFSVTDKFSSFLYRTNLKVGVIRTVSILICIWNEIDYSESNCFLLDTHVEIRNQAELSN